MLLLAVEKKAGSACNLNSGNKPYQKHYDKPFTLNKGGWCEGRKGLNQSFLHEANGGQAYPAKRDRSPEHLAIFVVFIATK